MGSVGSGVGVGGLVQGCVCVDGIGSLRYVSGQVGLGVCVCGWYGLTPVCVSRMAEWLKKQADREAEKEQRRMERLQRKLAEPKHYFNDPEYERQCQDLSERVEESIKKGPTLTFTFPPDSGGLLFTCDSA